MSLGKRNLGSGGGGATLSADGSPTYVAAGITFDWTLFPVAGTDITLADGSVVPAGARYIPFGGIIARVTANGANQGYYGPYELAAADGRQTLTRGSAFCMNQTVTNADLDADTGNMPGAIEAGRIYSSRLKILLAGVYNAFVPNNTFLGVFPGFRFAEH